MWLGVALTLTLCGLAPAQTAPEQSMDRPVACAGSAMAFDRARNRLVLFDGGGDSRCGPELRRTWEHDGDGWRLVVEDEGPTPRNFHAMVFDEARGVVLLYGGLCRQTRRTCTDAWIWDGATWTEIPTEGPGARYAPVLTYDPDRQVVLLFGGRDGLGPFRDLWAWDGTSWTQLWTGQRGDF